MIRILPPIFHAAIILFALTRCTPDSSPPATAPDDLGPVASIIRNPVVDGSADTVNVAQLTFEEVRWEFGKLAAGGTVEHDFAFTNTGSVPLLIADTRTTCGCTVADYPKQPVPPGEGGSITVRFDSSNKSGRQEKPIEILANTYPSSTIVTISGTVVE